MRWISTVDGDLDQGKLKTVAAVAIAVAGAAALIAGTLYQTFRNAEAEISGLLWMAGVSVAPLTGVSIGAGFGMVKASAAAKLQARTSAAVPAIQEPPPEGPKP